MRAPRSHLNWMKSSDVVDTHGDFASSAMAQVVPVLCVPKRSAWPVGVAPRCAFVNASVSSIASVNICPRRRGMSGVAATRARSGRFNVGEQSFIAFSCRSFRALALATWRKVVLDVSITRADGAAATWEKTSKRELVSTRLAYSTTSSSAETSFLARRNAQRQARQPEIV